LRFKLFKRKQGRLFILAIDLSGSMALNRIAQAKGAMLALLRQSYIKRDSIAIIGFRGVTAELLLPPSRSILRARRVLDSVGVGGGTPLSAGLYRSLQLARRTKEGGEKVLLLFTDGHANVALGGNGTDDRAARRRTIDAEVAHFGAALKESSVRTIIVDTSAGYRSNGDAHRIAEILGAHFESVGQLDGST
jgi:magnesium chelatase subunit D